MSSFQTRRWWYGLTKNLNAKAAALPMIFTALVVFVGCSLWTVLYSFTKSKLIPVNLFQEGGFLGFINSNAFVGLAQYEPLLNRRPAELSGGQRQRVAIGRALVRDVDVFLFDEPLSNLDAKLRTDLRVEIKRLHQRLKNTMIYVTHDQIEAMTLADRIAIMRDGLIQQLDTPYNIYNNPVNKYVAGFIGSPSMNFLDGTLEGGAKPLFRAGNLSIPLGEYAFTQKIGKGKTEGVTMGVRPEHVLFGDLAKKAAFKADVTVEVVEPMGADTQVWSVLDGRPFRFRVEGQLQLASGDVVAIGFDPSRGSLFDAADQRL